MGQTEALQREFAASIETLERRLVSSADMREKRAIAAALIVLSAEQTRLQHADLLATLQSLATARDELERAVGAARLGPFEGYLCALEHHLERLDRVSGRLHAKLALPKATLRSSRSGALKQPAGRRALARRASAVANF